MDGEGPIRFEGGQANLFAYVRSDPINGRDPMGLQGAGTDSCSYFAARCIGNTGDYYCVEAPKWCQGFGNSTWANCVRACLISWDSALHPSAKPYTPAYDSEHGLCPSSRPEPPQQLALDKHEQLRGTRCLLRFLQLFAALRTPSL